MRIQDVMRKDVKTIAPTAAAEETSDEAAQPAGDDTPEGDAAKA